MKLIKKLGVRISSSGSEQSWGLYWCDFCEQEVEKLLSNGNKCKSCGCNFSTHKEGSTRLYYIWAGMKQRCLNPNSQAYKDYGGRGITICPEWTESYIVFRDWPLNNGYTDNLQINRIENEGNYEPTNCNFVTAKENMRNTRNKKIENIEQADEIRELYKTGNYIQEDLAKKYFLSRQHISSIINNKSWV